MTRSNKMYYVFLFFVFGFLGGCVNLPEEELEKIRANNSLNELTVPEEFEFETTQGIRLLISVKDENGQVIPKVPIGLYNGPANLGGVLVGSGQTNSSGELILELLIGTDQSSLYAYTPYGTIARTQIIPITTTEIQFEWGNGALIADGFRRAQASTFGCGSGFYQVIQGSLKKLDVLSGTYLDLGAASSNYNGIGFNSEDSLIYGIRKSGNTYLLWRINTNGSEESLGEISNYPVSNSYKGDFDLTGNLYAPYFSGGSWTLYEIDVDQNPLSALATSLTELNEVDNAHDFAYNAGQDKFYGMTQNSRLIELDHQEGTIRTIADYRSEIGNGTYGALWCDTGGNIFASENSSGHIYKIDMDANGNPSQISFVMVGESTKSNDGASCPLATSPFNDADGDQVLDGIDAYPEDSTLAFDVYYPAKNTFGSYAFEDLWPVQGDYDFNDLIVDFNYEFAKNPSNLITKAKLRFRIQAIGAGFENAFGISFDQLNPSDIASISGVNTSDVTLSSNGTESNQSSAVIIIFDNGHALFGENPGKFINSGGQGSVIRDPVNITVEIDFSNPISSVGVINPFIYTRGKRSHEIHLMNYAPTDLMDVSLFNTNDDRSSILTGGYYRGNNGLPWGLEFPNSFTYPTEKILILNAYPKFFNWVSSSGISDVDWYYPTNGIVDSVYVQ